MVRSLRFADGVEVPVPGFGAMGISFALGNSLSYEEAEPVLLKALELGCTFWDTAVGLISNAQRQTSSLISRFNKVSYGAGVNEKILGDFIRKHNCRDKIFRMCPLSIG
jgi:aryl-alcohol dehydrogenase-like predicted oxidoreductase